MRALQSTPSGFSRWGSPPIQRHSRFAHAVLFRLLAYHRPEQLVDIAEMIPQFSYLYPRIPVNAIHFFEWRKRCRSFSDLAILESGSMNLTAKDAPSGAPGLARVSANLLPDVFEARY